MSAIVILLLIISLPGVLEAIPGGGPGDTATHWPQPNRATIVVTDGSFPAVGGSLIDPQYGVRVTRKTNAHPSGDGDVIFHNKNQLWNADSTAHLVADPVGGIDVVDPNTYSVIRNSVPYSVSGTTETTFDPARPNFFVYTNGTALSQYDLSTGSSSTVKTFASTLGSLGATIDWVDRTGRYFLLNHGGFGRVWDKQLDVLYTGNLVLSDLGAGWAGISPDGNWVVKSNSAAQQTAHAVNHTAQTLNATGHLIWSACLDHADIMSASDGKTYMINGGCFADRFHYRIDVSVDRTGLTAAQQIVSTGTQALFQTDASGVTGSGYYTCASRQPNNDWCVVGTVDATETDGAAGTGYSAKQEILLVHMLPPFEVYRLVHHRSRVTDAFCRNPRISGSWGLTRIWFTSNYGVSGSGSSCGYADTYEIQLGSFKPRRVPLRIGR